MTVASGDGAVAIENVDGDLDLVASGFVDQIDQELHPERYEKVVGDISNKICNLSQLDSDKASMVLGQMSEKRKHSESADASTRAPSMCESEVSESPEVQEQKFWEAAREKGFNFLAQGKKGNPMAGRFQRWLNAPEHAKDKKQYAALQSNRAEQQKWRQRWAQKRYDEYMESRKENLQYF